MNRQLRRDQMHEDDAGDVDLHAAIDYSDAKEQLSSWLKKKDVIQFIRNKFGNFLRQYRDKDEKHVYEERIQTMCQENKTSIEIHFGHMSHRQPTLAIWLAEEPSCMLPILNEVASDIVQEIYPEYLSIHPKIYVRVSDLPVEDKIRELRQIHLNALIKFRGVITKRSSVFPQLQQIYFRCSCGDVTGPYFFNNQHDARQTLGRCPICQ